MKTYHVILMNCDDCGSTYIARTNKISSPILAIRCIHCYKILGCMQYRYLGTIKAIDSKSAVEQYKKEWKKKHG